LVNDLSQVFPQGAAEDMLFQIDGTAGFTPPVQHIAKHYPVITRLVPVTLDGCASSPWGMYSVLRYFNWGTQEMTNVKSMTQNDSNTGIQTEFIAGDFMLRDLPVALDTSYHTVKTDGKHILVILK
jgi:hypothetical protein